MQDNSPNQKIPIASGVIIGQLEVIDRVTLVKQHECFYDTPKSYLIQGSIWECYCRACGNKKLISEAMLAKGTLRSCGCLRQKQWQEARERKRKRQLITFQRKQVLHQIKTLQWRLAELKLPFEKTPEQEQEILDVGKELQRLFLVKRGYAKTITHLQHRPKTKEQLEEIKQCKEQLLKLENTYYSMIRKDDMALTRAPFLHQIKLLRRHIKNLEK